MGRDAFCATLTTDEFAGNRLERLAERGPRLPVKSRIPKTIKLFGLWRVEGDSISLKGCALKIFCKSVNWTGL